MSHEYGWIERLRGVDRWPLVRATVTSVQQTSEGGRGGAWRRVFFTYRFRSEDYGGEFSVDSNSSVYEVATGDSFEIQCNPRKPSRYFCEEAKTLSSTVTRVMLAIVLLIIFFVIAAHLFDSRV